MTLNNREIAIVKGMKERGDKNQDIAAYFGINQGRISEIKNGKGGIGVGIGPADQADLPPSGPYLAARSAFVARDTLLAMRDLLDAALQEIERFESVKDNFKKAAE